LAGKRGHTVATWSMCWERSVVNCEARVSRVSGEAEVCGVLIMAAWREAVWLIRSGVLYSPDDGAGAAFAKYFLAKRVRTGQRRDEGVGAGGGQPGSSARDNAR
jgi:hypothetical protein